MWSSSIFIPSLFAFSLTIQLVQLYKLFLNFLLKSCVKILLLLTHVCVLHFISNNLILKKTHYGCDHDGDEHLRDICTVLGILFKCYKISQPPSFGFLLPAGCRLSTHVTRYQDYFEIVETSWSSDKLGHWPSSLWLIVLIINFK